MCVCVCVYEYIIKIFLAKQKNKNVYLHITFRNKQLCCCWCLIHISICFMRSELKVPAGLLVRRRLICVLRETVEITGVQRPVHLRQTKQTHFLWMKTQDKAKKLIRSGLQQSRNISQSKIISGFVRSTNIYFYLSEMTKFILNTWIFHISQDSPLND